MNRLGSLKNFCSVKDPVKHLNKQATRLKENIYELFANHVSDKEYQ